MAHRYGPLRPQGTKPAPSPGPNVVATLAGESLLDVARRLGVSWQRLWGANRRVVRRPVNTPLPPGTGLTVPTK